MPKYTKLLPPQEYDKLTLEEKAEYIVEMADLLKRRMQANGSERSSDDQAPAPAEPKSPDDQSSAHAEPTSPDDKPKADPIPPDEPKEL